MADFFGLDIGTHSIKAVQLRREKGKPVLVSYATVNSPPQVLKSEADEDRKALSTAIKNLLQEAEIKTANVVAALPEAKLFTGVVEFPKMSAKELASSLEYEAEQYLPTSVKDSSFDFEIVDERGDKMDVLLVAAPNALVNRYLAVLEGAGLTVLALEPETAACVRSLMSNGADSPPTLLVSIGASTTDLVIAERGKIKFARSVATGGKALGRAVAQAFGFEEEQAESYKRSYGLEGEKLEGKIVEALKPVFKVIVEEMKRSLDFYHSRDKGTEVRRIVLAGGSANLPGVVVYLAFEFGLEVQLGNPWRGVAVGETFKREELEEVGPSLAVAIGLALRDVEED